MATAPPYPLIHHIRRLAGARPGPDLPDAHLLARFASDGEQAAFAALVQRHGPLVLGVCRRILGDWHAAEDTFQEVFVLLARRAGSLRNPERLGPWLFGVAHRTALKARGRAARRRVCERAAAPSLAVEPVDDLIWRDLRPVLDDAVARLPTTYREAFVLHYLQGARVEDVARRLGCPRGTVATRLARARAQLRKGLTRRGVSLPAAALATTLFAKAGAACVPAALRFDTARAAAVAAGQTALLGGGLMQGGMAMVTTKLKVAALVLLGLGVAAGGGAALSGTAPRPEAAAEATGAAKGAARADTPDADLIRFLDGSTHFFREEYRPAAVVFARLAQKHPNSRLAPAASALAVLARQLNEGKAADAARAITEGRAQISAALGQRRTDARGKEAEKDFNVAEFYRRTGRPGAACFYYELVSRRYPGTTFATRAAERLRAVRKPAGAAQEAENDGPTRVGRILVNGNRSIPTGLILYQLSLRPGEVLTYPALSGAERNLAALRGVTATVSVLDADTPGAFKDVLVQVEERLPGARKEAAKEAPRAPDKATGAAPLAKALPLRLADLQLIAQANSPLLRQAAAAVQAARGDSRQPGMGIIAYYVRTGQLRDAELRPGRLATEISEQVRSAYKTVLMARKEVLRAQERFCFAFDALDLEKQKVRAGPAPADASERVKQALTKAAQARGALQQARGDYLQAWGQLAAAIGCPAMPPTELAESDSKNGALPSPPAGR